MRIVMTVTIVLALMHASNAFAQESGHLNVRTVVQKEEVCVGTGGNAD